MRSLLRNTTLHIVLAVLLGLGLGLTYSWFISPVTYVDASPAILRSDFKDQYRIVIAASYAASHDLARARARLQILGDTDSVGELSAQAQRMLSSGDSLENIEPLAQLATDLQQGFASIPATNGPLSGADNSTPISETSIANATETEPPIQETPATPFATLSFEQTALIPIQGITTTPRPTFTPVPGPGAPFTLVGQDPICEPSLQPGLLQFMLIDGRRRQVPGIGITVTWSQGEDRFFTGFKPDLGNGYADFVMQPDIVYNVRIIEGGAFVPNVSAPPCTDPNGNRFTGGLLLTFQQP